MEDDERGKGPEYEAADADCERSEGVVVTAEFPELAAAEQDELWRIYKLYWREARRSQDADAHLAACIMLGSALETLLILMINTYSEEAFATGKWPTRSGDRKPLLDLSLVELLRIVKGAGWLPYGRITNRLPSKKAAATASAWSCL